MELFLSPTSVGAWQCHAPTRQYNLKNENLENRSRVHYQPLWVHLSQQQPNKSTSFATPQELRSGNAIIMNTLSVMGNRSISYGSTFRTIICPGNKTNCIQMCRRSGRTIARNLTISPSDRPSNPNLVNLYQHTLAKNLVLQYGCFSAQKNIRNQSVT